MLKASIPNAWQVTSYGRYNCFDLHEGYRPKNVIKNCLVKVSIMFVTERLREIIEKNKNWEGREKEVITCPETLCLGKPLSSSPYGCIPSHRLEQSVKVTSEKHKVSHIP